MSSTYIRRVTYASGHVKDTVIEPEDIETSLERNTPAWIKSWYGRGTVAKVGIVKVTEEVLSEALMP